MWDGCQFGQRKIFESAMPDVEDPYGAALFVNLVEYSIDSVALAEQQASDWTFCLVSFACFRTALVGFLRNIKHR